MGINLRVTKAAEFNGHLHPVYILEAAPGKGRFFSAGGDKMIVEWGVDEPGSGKVIAKLPSSIYALQLIREKNHLLAGTAEGGIHIIDLETGEEIRYYQLPGEPVFDIRYSPVHQLIAASTSKGNVWFLQPGTYDLLYNLHVADDKIRSVDFNPVRPYLYMACSDSNLYIADLEKRAVIHHFKTHSWACNVVYYDAEKDELITASRDAHIRTWNLKKNLELEKNIPAHNYAIYKLAYNPALHIFASASRDKTVKLWDRELNILTRINKENHDGHINSVNTVLWLENDYLLTAGDDKKIIGFEIRN